MRENIEYEGSHTYDNKKSRNFRSIWLDHSSSAQVTRVGEIELIKGTETMEKAKGERTMGWEIDWENTRMKERETQGLPRPLPLRVMSHDYSLSLSNIGSHALLRTHNWGSFRPRPLVVFSFLISRLSRTRRFFCRLAFVLLLKVAMSLGSSQFIWPAVHSRACFDIPEIFASALFEETSFECCPILVRNETRVWPMYFKKIYQKKSIKKMVMTWGEIWSYLSHMLI